MKPTEKTDRTEPRHAKVSSSPSSSDGLASLNGVELGEILDSIPHYVMLIDEAHHIFFANKAVRAHLGLTSAQVQGEYCPRLIHGVDHYPGCPVEEAIKGGPTEKVHYATEIDRWMWTTAYPTGVRTKEGLQLYYHAVKDVTDEMMTRENLAHNERKFRHLFAALEDGVFVMTSSGMLLDVNPAGMRLLGIHSEKETAQFNLYTDLTTLDGGWGPFIKTLRTAKHVTDHELDFLRPEGGVTSVSISANIVVDDSDESGMVRGIIRDLTHSRELEQQATTDALTGLFNRHVLESRLHNKVRRIQSGADMELSVLFIDIDDFKAYNDIYGHQEGDYVLKRAALAIESVLRDEDVGARYGGEEFAVLLDCGPSMAREVAERIRTNVAGLCSPSADGKIKRDVTVSIGSATLGSDGHSGETLIKAADSRMYAAKKTGKNRVCGAPMHRVRGAR